MSVTSLDDVWQAVDAYLASNREGVERDALRDSVAQLVAQESGAAPPNLYVAKLTDQGLRNQVWQGAGNTRPYDAFVLLDQTRSPSSVLQAVKSRLSPVDVGGFDAAIIAERLGADDWRPVAVVQYEHSRIGETLRSLVGDESIEIKAVADPARKNPGASGPTSDEDAPWNTEDVILHLQEALNVILTGPPGTGKTKLSLDVVTSLSQGHDPTSCRLEAVLKGRDLPQVPESEILDPPLIWEMIQCHPSYGYDDFVRGIRVDPDAEGFSLRVMDGLFTRIAHVALQRKGRPTLLIIDEINRGNLSSMLGETIFALDRAHRGQAVRLQHEGDEGGSHALTVPSNLWVLGTMNSADRSVAMVDFAIRRRFRFLRQEPSASVLRDFYSSRPTRAAAVVELFELVQSAIPAAHLRPGHSYYLVQNHEGLGDQVWADRLSRKLTHELRPLLIEYRSEGERVAPIPLTGGEGTRDLAGPADDDLERVLRDWLLRSRGEA